MNSCSRNRTRRSLQGGLAFVAFGALSLAAALPAHADTGEVGYARATVAGEADISVFHSQAADFHGTYRYLDAFDGEIFAASRTFARVDVVEDELVSQVTLEELRIELTEGDIEAMREAAVDGVSQPGLENPEGGSDELLLQASFTGPVIVTSQNWAGEQEFVHEEGDQSVEVDEIGAEFSFVTETSPWEETFEGQPLWGVHQALDLVVEFPEEEFSVTYRVGETWVGADIPPVTDGGGEDGEDGDDNGDTGNGHGGPGEGDEGSEGSEGSGGESGEGSEGGSGTGKGEDGSPADEKGGKADEGNGADEDLARTGVPVGALITVGAAVASVGGAATYLARRRKNTAENTETSES
ncbi:hypothetical protein NE857_01420 [Nocardiopsis exhalans]|uniref:Uncharacterized protein n=1 Tax=Nocardiopsis exhalans TaxID=163604 RepID=A0ABY5DBB3_9ACTN|nr:hypothetical protein [Nocardiopsis exhalans]USY20351.1 hypothetical protein NE857_01420 [Nocardiopsis exhalans]